MENVCVGHGPTKRKSIKFSTNSEIKWLHDTNVINVAIDHSHSDSIVKCPKPTRVLHFCSVFILLSLSTLSLEVYPIDGE